MLSSRAQSPQTALSCQRRCSGSAGAAELQRHPWNHSWAVRKASPPEFLIFPGAHRGFPSDLAFDQPRAHLLSLTSKSGGQSDPGTRGICSGAGTSLSWWWGLQCFRRWGGRALPLCSTLCFAALLHGKGQKAGTRVTLLCPESPSGAFGLSAGCRWWEGRGCSLLSSGLGDGEQILVAEWVSRTCTLTIIKCREHWDKPGP